MVWLVWGTSAYAAPLGSLFGAPFDAVTALGLTDPARPGFSVLLTTEPLTCESFRGPPDALEPPTHPMVIAAFDGAPAASAVLAFGPEGLGSLTGAVTLTKSVSRAGDEGALHLDLTAAKAPKGALGAVVATHKGDRLRGDVSFRLCGDLGQRPSLAGTTFEVQDVHVERRHLGDEPPEPLADLTMPVPVGWTRRDGTFGDPAWIAPDQVTSMSVSVASPFDTFEADAQEWADTQIAAFQTEGTASERVRSGSAGDGAYVVRWRYRWTGKPWTNEVDVLLQRDGWAHEVKCSVSGPDASVAEVFDAAEQACLALILR